MIAVMSDAPPELEGFWRENARDRVLAPGEALVRAGDPVRLLFRVEEGVVSLSRPLPNGSALILQRAGPGELLAEASLFSATYQCDATAMTAARVRGIAIATLLQTAAGRPALGLAFARHLAFEVQRVRARAELLCLRTVAERLDAWLALGDRTLPPRGRWREVAAEIAVSPEALYREVAARRS